MEGNTVVSTHLLLWDPCGLSPGPCDLVSWLHQCTISTLTAPLLYFSRSPSNTRVEGHVCACLGDRWMSAHHFVSTRLLFFPHKKFLILTGPLNHCVLKHSARNKGVMLTNSCTWLVKVLILAGPWEEAQRFLPNQKVGIRHDMKKKKKRLYFGTKRSRFETLYMATGEPCARRRRVMSHECTINLNLLLVVKFFQHNRFQDWHEYANTCPAVWTKLFSRCWHNLSCLTSKNSSSQHYTQFILHPNLLCLRFPPMPSFLAP